MFTDKDGKFHCSTPFNHDTIIQHVVELLSSLKPEAWGAASALDGSQQYLESPLTQHDATPTPILLNDTQKWTSSMLAPLPLLSVERPF